VEIGDNPENRILWSGTVRGSEIDANIDLDIDANIDQVSSVSVGGGGGKSKKIAALRSCET
jgi:hypothetical protein